MLPRQILATQINTRSALLTFFAITTFYFFEATQMSYFNVLAPYYLSQHIYHQIQIAGLSSAYYYGNVLGLLPVGFALDRFPLRKILLWAISGSVISAILLAFGHGYSIEWIARFFCGFFGGTFSFVGGIRVLLSLFPERFSLFIGIFIAAGMLAGFVCQYPLLAIVNHIGIQGAIGVMVIFGLIIALINLIYLRPPVEHLTHSQNKYPGTTWQMCIEILRNYRNWLDCLMVVFLDTPISIIGALWGIVLLMNIYHFSDGMSAIIVMALFAGLTIGSTLWGMIGERYHQSPWLIICGGGVSFILLISMIVIHHANAILVGCLFFGLGLFSSCQAIGFTWLTKNMRPELVGRNSAFNSMFLMGSGGALKQIGAALLAMTSFLIGKSSAINLLVLMAAMMLLVTLYAGVRKILFKNLVY